MCLDIHEQQPALVAVGLYDGRCGVLTVGVVYCACRVCGRVNDKHSYV